MSHNTYFYNNAQCSLRRKKVLGQVIKLAYLANKPDFLLKNYSLHKLIKVTPDIANKKEFL